MIFNRATLQKTPLIYGFFSLFANHRGNTTEKYAILLLPQSIFTFFFSLRGNGKRATLQGRFLQ